MPTWEELKLLSSSVAQSVRDDAGNITSAGTIEDASTVIDPRISDFVLYGVFNGAFARGPQDPNANIDAQNALPDWTGPTQVSGGAITLSWVADASSPSGYNARFTINAGAAGDEAYIEQIVPIGGSRSRAVAHLVRAFFRLAATDGGGSPYAYVKAQYLTAALATTGSEASVGPASLTAIGDTDLLGDPTISGAGAPADAVYLRIRIDIARGGLPASASASIDVTDVRADSGKVVYYVSDNIDPVTYGPADLSQASGIIYLEGVSGQNGPFLKIDTVTHRASLYSQLLLGPPYSYLFADSATGITLDASNATAPTVIVRDNLALDDELAAAPTTPASGWKIYARDDDTLRAKNATGQEYVLSAVTSQAVFPSGTMLDDSGNPLEDDFGNIVYFAGDVTAATGDSFDFDNGHYRRIHYEWNGTQWWGDYEQDYWSPLPALATPGTSTWVETPNAVVGRYTRIGQLVTIAWDWIGTFTIGTGSGSVSLSGLPYTVNASSSTYYYASGGSFVGPVTKANMGGLNAYVYQADNHIYFTFLMDNGTLGGDVPGSTLTSGATTYFNGTITYEIINP